MLFDIHGDIWTDVTVRRLSGEKDIIKNHHLDRFKKGNMSGGIFVVWADPPHDKRATERLYESIGAMSAEIHENRDLLQIIYNSKDFYKAIENNKLAVMLGLEGLAGIGEDIEKLYSLYQFGFRHVSLTWNEENKLATGVGGDVNRGLTKSGIEAVKLINKLGMVLDVSHLNEKSFWDVYKASEKPFIASHSNARSLCNVPRNLWDDQIKAIGERDGLVGINAFNEFIHRDPEKRNVDFLINHIEHIGNLIGIEKIALGFDFFEYLEGDTTDEFTEEPYQGTKGLEDISQSSNLIEKLEKKGFTKEQIEGLSYKNFMNYLDRI